MPSPNQGPAHQNSGPGAHAFVIVPDDVNKLAHRTRGLYVGVAGNVSVEMAEDGTAIIFTSLSAGIIHPIAVRRVNATGTTATNIVGIY